jgi:hypothetical protein
MTTELTVRILEEIRDAVRETNQRVIETSLRIDQTNLRLDQTIVRLDQTIVRIQAVEGAVVEMAQQQRFVVRYLKALARKGRDLGKSDARLAGEIADLRVRVETLETKIDSK